MAGIEYGDVVLMIDEKADYGVAYEAGKAAFYDYLRAGHEAEQGLFFGGLLQRIISSLVNEPPSDATRGFIVGFFYEMETTLSGAFFNQQTTDHIKRMGLNLPPSQKRQAQGGEA